MKFSTVKKFAEMYNEAEDKVTVTKISDSRLGSHTYAYWTEGYELSFGDKQATFKVRTDESAYLSKSAEAMVKVGALPEEIDGEDIKWCVLMHYNLKKLSTQIRHAFEAANAVERYEKMELFHVDGYLWPELEEGISDLVADDAEIKDGLSAYWEGPPCAVNPTPKKWEIALQEAQKKWEAEKKRKNREYAQIAGRLSHKYKLPFETCLLLGSDECLHKALCEVRGKFLTEPDKYRIDVNRLYYNDVRYKELYRLLEMADNELLYKIPRNSAGKEVKLAIFFEDVAELQEKIRQQNMRPFVTRATCWDEFSNMRDDIEQVVFRAGKEGAYALRKDLQSLSESKIKDLRKAKVLEWSYSNAGVTRALKMWAPRYSKVLEKNGVSAYDGDIVGLKIVKHFVEKTYVEKCGRELADALQEAFGEN